MWARFKERFRGYEATLRLKGADFNPALVKHIENIPSNIGHDILENLGYESTKTLLDQQNGQPSFTALFGATDEIAFGAIRAIQERGLSVPGDISVIGFDDLPASLTIFPS